MPEWLIGFIGGVLATVLGFVLTMSWDLFKHRKEAKEREKTVEGFVGMELTENRRILLSNQRLLENELRSLDENKMLVLPLTLFRMGFWELLKGHLPFPGKYRSSSAVLDLLVVVELTTDINETMRSREVFRLHNQGTADFVAQIRIYDKRLIEDGQMLLKYLDKLDPEAKEYEHIAEELLKS